MKPDLPYYNKKENGHFEINYVIFCYGFTIDELLFVLEGYSKIFKY